MSTVGLFVTENSASKHLGPFFRITAYVVKVFSMVHSVIGVDEAQVCGPLLYLLKNKYDESRNFFREDNPVYSPTIMVSDPPLEQRKNCDQ